MSNINDIAEEAEKTSVNFEKNKEILDVKESTFNNSNKVSNEKLVDLIKNVEPVEEMNINNNDDSFDFFKFFEELLNNIENGSLGLMLKKEGIDLQNIFGKDVPKEDNKVPSSFLLDSITKMESTDQDGKTIENPGAKIVKMKEIEVEQLELDKRNINNAENTLNSERDINKSSLGTTDIQKQININEIDK